MDVLVLSMEDKKSEIRRQHMKEMTLRRLKQKWLGAFSRHAIAICTLSFVIRAILRPLSDYCTIADFTSPPSPYSVKNTLSP